MQPSLLSYAQVEMGEPDQDLLKTLCKEVHALSHPEQNILSA